MKSKLVVHSLVVMGVLGVFAPKPASAHFKLTQPVDALKTDATGDPMNGSQKSSPCGSGTASGLATQVHAGSKLHIKLTETVAHGGHYRIALAPKRTSFVDPEPVVEDGNCVSAPIESPPTAPVLADGLFEHTDDEFGNDKVWETDVTLPNEPCADCTLQIIEFMTPHAPGCFYYHCANLQILAADATIEGDGVVNISTGESSSGQTTSGGENTSGGTSGTSGGGTSGASGTSGTSGRRLASTPANDGCNVAPDGGGGSSVISFGVVLAMVIARLWRRSREEPTHHLG